MNQWQPIETAPKDGVYLLANPLGEVCPCDSKDGFRVVHNGFGAPWTWGQAATHWMPLPEPPK